MKEARRIFFRINLLRRYDMNERSQMQGGKNWILPKKTNANRFLWDSHWLEIWKNLLCPSMGPNGGSVAMDSVFFAYRARAGSLESLIEGQNWFLNQIDGRDSTEIYHGLSAEAGYNLPPLEISCSWPPSPESTECLMFTGLIYFEAIFFTDGFFLVKGSCLLIEEVSLAKHTCHRGR